MNTTLSHLEFDIIWEHLGFGERPYPIDVGSFGATVEQRVELLEQVRDSLRHKGLHDGTDLDQDLSGQLALLVTGDVTVDGQLSVGEYLRVLAATRGGDRGVLVIQSDAEVRVRELDPARGRGAPAEVIALVPDRQPGPGGSVRLARVLFDEAVDTYVSGGYPALERTLQRGGVGGRELRTVISLVESGRTGGGQLAANSTDRMGRRTRSPVLNWFDTEHGRYLTHLDVARDREEWLTITPADTGRLAQRLNEMVAGVGNG